MSRQAPPQCPLCASDLRCNSPETEDDFAEWKYECGAILHLQKKEKLFAYANCPRAMREALALLNKSV